MKKFSLLAFFVLFVLLSCMIFTMELPLWPENLEEMNEERVYSKSTITNGLQVELQEVYLLSYCWIETLDDGKTLEITHFVSNEMYINGEKSENLVAGLLNDLVLAVEFDENFFIIDTHGYEELNRRINAISDPIKRQIVNNLISKEKLKASTVNEWNDLRKLIFLAIEELNQALEWDYETVSNGITIPYTAQLLGEKGTYQGQEVYVIQFNQFYNNAKLEKGIEDELVDMMGLSIPPGIKLHDVDSMVFNTTYTTMDNKYPIATEKYVYYLIELEAAGEVVTIKMEEETLTYSVKYVQKTIPE